MTSTTGPTVSAPQPAPLSAPKGTYDLLPPRS
jgi:hypothetical protein